MNQLRSYGFHGPEKQPASFTNAFLLISSVLVVTFLTPGMIVTLHRDSRDHPNCVASSLEVHSTPPPLQIVQSSRFRGDSATHYYLDHSGHGTVSASSSWSDAFDVSFAVDDDDVDTAWSSSHEGEAASMTVTFTTPTAVSRVGARSRDMVNAYADPAYQTDDSVIRSFKLYVDDVLVALCNMTGNYDLRVASPSDHSLPGVIPPRGSGSAWERMHYCGIRETTGYRFRLEAEEILPGAVNNTGFVEIELMERLPVPEAMTVSHLSACAKNTEDATEFAWGDDLFSFNMAPGRSFWDVDVYIPGRDSYSNTVSGSWLCSVASSSADLVGMVQYVDADPMTQQSLLPVRNALSMGGLLTKPWPTSSTSGPKFDNTFMPQLNAFCTDAINADATSQSDIENKFLLTFLCEAFYINAMLYRVEAFLAPVSDGLTLELPSDSGMTKRWVEDVFGFDSHCSRNCKITIGPVVVTRPLGKYLYYTRKPMYEALATSGNALAQYLKQQSGVIWYDGYMGSYETHYKAAMDGAAGMAASSLEVEWLGNGYYPPNYRICPTSQAFFKKLVRMKSKHNGKSLLCTSVVQQMVDSINDLLGIEIDLRQLDTSSGTEVSNTAITDGNTSMCNSSHSSFFDKRFEKQFKKGGIYTSLKPTFTPPAPPHPGVPPSIVTTTPMGVFGVTHMTGKTFMGVYSSFMAIQNLHVPQMDDFCKTNGFTYTLYPMGIATFQMMQGMMMMPSMANFSVMWTSVGGGDPEHPAMGSTNSLYSWDAAAFVEAAIAATSPVSIIDSPDFLNTPMPSTSAPTSFAYSLAGFPIGLLEAKHMAAHSSAVMGVESVYVM